MKASRVLVHLIMIVLLLQPIRVFSQEMPPDLPVYLRDRGTGFPTSQFGTYIQKGQLLVYPFYEYYYDKNFEYEPGDYGYGSTKELRGRYEAHEGLIFLAYGITDRLMLEFEASVITAKLDKSAQDTTAQPPQLKKSGVNDVEGQVRWRWNFENEHTPEFFTYFEYVLPTGEKNSLIGTSVWEFKLGSGLIKGYPWGTITFRVAFDYDTGEKRIAPGEYALEYLKRLSNHFRIFAMVEGSEDEVAFVPEIQWHINRNIFVKANTGVGITSKAADFAPEIGVMFSLFP
jgi:hypothetical protein